MITDPRTLGIPYPRIADPDHPTINRAMFMPPLPLREALHVGLVKGPNIELLPDEIEVPVLPKVGSDVSTDEIMPRGFRVLPLTFVDPADYDGIQAGDLLRTLTEGDELVVENVTRQQQFQVRHFMSPRQVQHLLIGGLINWMKERLSGQ